MYLPAWFIVIAVILFVIYKTRKNGGLRKPLSNVDDIESSVAALKTRVFQQEHFDSPHWVDMQDAFDAMEVNYFRLKQRLSNEPERVLEIAKDWRNYVNALGDIKFARVMLDVDTEDNAWDNAGERMKEPYVIKDEVEKKFTTLLGKDFQEIPPDYFKRLKKAKIEPGLLHALNQVKGTAKENQGEDALYADSPNYWRMKENRAKFEEEMKSKVQPKKNE